MTSLYQAAGISKTAHIKAVKREVELDNKVIVYVGFIMKIRQDHPGMGLRAIYQQFGPTGIGRDAFIALGMQQGFRLRQPHNPMITTRGVKSARFANLLVDLELRDVNQVWVSDLFYFPCQEKHYYGVLIMDAYSRRIVGYSMSNNMQAEQTLLALARALTLRGIEDYENTLIHHSDRGSQYVSNIYTDTLDEAGIRISMCTTVLENAHAERLNGTVKNQYLEGYDTSTPAKLIRSTDRAVSNYNVRAHQSLDGMTPINYEIYLKSVPTSQRKTMIIFTRDQVENPDQKSQLSLFDGVENSLNLGNLF